MNRTWTAIRPGVGKGRWLGAFCAAAFSLGVSEGCLLPDVQFEPASVTPDAAVSVTEVRGPRDEDAGVSPDNVASAAPADPDAGSAGPSEGLGTSGTVPRVEPPPSPPMTSGQATGQPCLVASDCESLVCGAGGCAPEVASCCQPARCNDGVANGGEPVPDCGNAACGACPQGSACTANAQCASALCSAGRCRVAGCADGIRNGSETDTDCGGADPTCARCAVGRECTANADCAIGNCSSGICVSCEDGLRNGDETDIDCGGNCGACSPGFGCNSDGDCQSGACQNGRCCGGTQVDCTRCALRLAGSISCNSNGPAAAADCAAFLQCLADNSDACPVRFAPGCSEPGGVCNTMAFGGNDGPGIALADAILGTAQCSF